MLLEQADPSGRWVALCQAGAKGALERSLIAPGEELPIDGFLGADATGRFVLLSRHGALTLRDNQTGQLLDLSQLGADARLSAEPFAALRTASFDASSEHLLYVRPGEQGSRVVLRTLATGGERELDPGPGAIWRARLDPGGAFAVLEMLTSDSNKNGRADFPAPLLPAARACTAGPPRFRSWQARGDHPETVLLPLAGGAPIHEPDLLLPVADALLLRDGTGALLLERSGKKRVLEPAACKGRIVHADARRELFIIGCAQKKKTGRVSLELVTRTERKPLNVELASVELDREVSDAPRLVPLYPGADSALFDADRHELIALQTGDAVVATYAAHALIRRGKTLLIYDAEARAEQALPGTLARFPDVLVTEQFAFVSPLLVDVQRGVALSIEGQQPLALSNQGQLLVASVPADGPTLARGPLHWLTPAW